MRIALFSHNSKLEGAPLHLVRLATLFQRHGHTCTLVTPFEGPLNAIARQAGIAVQVTPDMLRSPKSLGKDLYADVFIANTIVTYSILGYLKKKFPHTRLLWIIHESERALYERMFPALQAKLFALPDCIAFPAHAVQEVYQDLPIQKAVSIHNGIDKRKNYDKAQLRAQYGIPADATVITLVGYLSERKAQLEFVESAIRLLHQSDTPLHFVLVGHYTSWHTLYRDYCVQRTVNEKLAEYFSFFSPTDDPFPFYCLSDIAVCPSYIEACPYVVLEAMACGLPVVASGTYGVREIIEHDVNGILVIPGHIEEITEALLTLIHNPEQREAMGKAATQRIKTVFNAERMYSQYAALCKELCAIPYLTNRQRFFGKLYRLWLSCGSPAPQLARFIRYRLLKRLWPDAKQTSAIATESSPRTELTLNATVSIVIPSHNYGAYLGDAIQSALNQTLKPKEIIVVDDASTDNTALIAAQFADQGVQYIRGEWHNVGKARNVAMKLTTAEFLIFLDADDMINPHYAACGAQTLLDNPSVGLAYPDSQFFGKSNLRTNVPETYDWELFDKQNHIFSPTMVRRTALCQVGGWAESDHQHLDWLTWRRILQLGWKAKKSGGIHLYRQHSSNMFHSYRKQYPFAYRSGLCTEPTTLCLSLSGRTWMWPFTQQFLEQQTLRHSQIHLCILDTSGNPEFGKQVQAWLAQCDYGGYSYQRLRVGRAGLADRPRSEVQQEVRDACATIYSTFARLAKTATVCFLEDDIVPPLHAYERLLEQFTPESVSVSGYYCHRGTNRPIAWNYDANGYPCDSTVGTGTTPIGGTGFGCLAVRGEYLRNSVFSSGPPLLNYDQNFFRHVSQHSYHTALIDWSLNCKHFSAPDTWS